MGPARARCEPRTNRVRCSFGACDVVATTQKPTFESPRTDRYQVTVEQYAGFRRDGFVVVPRLVSDQDVAELRQHTDDLMQGRLPEQRSTMADRDLKRDT